MKIQKKKKMISLIFLLYISKIKETFYRVKVCLLFDFNMSHPKY